MLPNRVLLWLLGSILLTGLLAGCADAPSSRPILAITPAPQVALTVDTVYYDITGANADELRAQMDTRGPADENGQHDAYTKWSLQWRYTYAQDANGCGVESLTVSLSVTFTLPRWTPPADASFELVDRWQAYLVALQSHENGHKSIAVEAANETATALSSLLTYASCAELERVADATGERILERYRQQEIAYDRETGHGAAQGARFP